jgi:hypothetical protein
MASCEDDHLKELSGSLEAFDCIWPKVNSSSSDLSVWKTHLNELVYWVVVDVFNTMD